MTFPWLIVALAASLPGPSNSPSAPLVIVVRGEEAALTDAAAELHRRLAEQPGLAPQAPAVARPVKTVAPLAAGESLLARARADFAQLDAAAAEIKLTELNTLLRPWLDVEGASLLLARAQRLRALVQLFVGEPEAAGRTFASAFFLNPEFSPAAEEWPPEARLAYADTVAAVRRAAPAALSIRVDPQVAEVWLDGSRRGIGPLTVSELAPGEHLLTVVCAGYERFAAVVELAGEGRLDQAEVFLSPLPVEDQRQRVLAALAEAVEQGEEETAVLQAQAVFAVEWLVLVGWDTYASESWRPAAWLFDADGRRRGGTISLLDLDAAAVELTGLCLGVAAAPPPVATPWYAHWITWAAAGAAVVGGSVALTLWLTADDSERVSFHIGGRR